MSENALKKQGIFDVKSVRDAWQQHLYGWANHSELMWSVLMFQAWLEDQQSSPATGGPSDLTPVVLMPAELVSGLEMHTPH